MASLSVGASRFSLLLATCDTPVDTSRALFPMISKHWIISTQICGSKMVDITCQDF